MGIKKGKRTRLVKPLPTAKRMYWKKKKLLTILANRRQWNDDVTALLPTEAFLLTTETGDFIFTEAGDNITTEI